VCLAVVAWGAAEAFVAGAAGSETVPSLQRHGRELERDAAQFLERYRQFLECCTADEEALSRVRMLESQAVAILDRARTGVASELKKLRGFTLEAVVAPMERVRDDLRAIRQRIEQIRDAEAKLAAKDLDVFTFWTEHRKLQDALAARPREFPPPARPAGPPTGVDIGVTPPMGPEIGMVPPTGLEVGTTPPTGPAIGEPRR
jgi:hypothetical protein